MREPTIIRSARRKTMSICVKEDLTVEVRIPTYVSKQQALQFVEKNQAWIAAQLQRQFGAERRCQNGNTGGGSRLADSCKKGAPSAHCLFQWTDGVNAYRISSDRRKNQIGQLQRKKRALCFSFRLMAYPQSAIDYVNSVHWSLAHIRHKKSWKILLWADCTIFAGLQNSAVNFARPTVSNFIKVVQSIF